MGTNKESKIANILLIGLAIVASFAPCRAQPVDILMKGYQPTKPNAYQCTAYKVPEVIEYINKFEAIGNLTRIHHIIVYGCDGSAASTLPSWSCPAMCRNAIDESILFAWARNGTPTVLPADVGFRIGSNTTVKTLVLQVHYAKPLTEKDYSGVRIYTTQESPKFVAGIFFMVANTFQLPRGFSAYAVDISCNYNFKETLSIFAVRAHTHGLGVVVSGYHRNSTGNHLIQKVNPQWPQTFYPVNGSIQVKPGDAVFARCIYDTTKAKSIVGVGPAGEMCNYYIMYYTDSSVQNTYYRCINSSRKDLTGNNFPPEGNIPLPPNVYLEEIAQGIEHNSSMSVRSVRSARVEPKENVIHDSTIDILMPGAKPSKPDAYLCTAYSVEDEEYYIYKFEALANAATAHHMLLYGCDGEPLSTESIWDCPGMCKNGRSTIMFAWAKNAPPTVLPKGVALRVGKNTSIKTIVLQVHYAKIFKDSEPPDHSGLKIYTTFQKPQFVAGIFLLASYWFEIPPQVSSYPVDISCTFQKEKSIFPFAYRTHAHGLGKVITGYQYNGTYHEIGKGNPQWPQAFYPVKEIIEVKPGDALAARCTYDSTSMDHSVGVGSTGNDEMCNYYIMFYTDSSVADPSGECAFNELTQLTGKNFPIDVSVPLPPNPALEEAAIGSHHHAGMNHPGEANVDFEDTQILKILMRGARPRKPDSYLCTAYPAQDLESYIYKFEAVADANTAHHMLLYGCDGEAYSQEPIWNCPAMCKNSHPVILFAWAKNALPTVLPKDVGLRFGNRTFIKTLVLQVHYARIFTDAEDEDHSGLKIYVTHKKQPYVAGVFFLASALFTIPQGHSSFPVDVGCRFSKEKSIFPFAYRPHAHGLGRVITGYQYNGSYHEIGKGNPQWPQTFYPVTNKIEVKNGDYLLGRCTYDSTSMDHPVNVGSTGNDEMCNFYIMFYTDSSVQEPYGECLGNSEPDLTGNNFPADVSVPLPPNPALEEEAKGVHNHHGGMAGGNNDVHLEKPIFNSSWPEESITFGQIGGVAIDTSGNVYVFHRGSRKWTAQSFNFDNDFRDQSSPITEDVITILTSSGHLIKTFGAGKYFMPHGITVDHEGNIWLTDVAMHQVFKIPPGQTEPKMTLGQKFQHGEDTNLFCKPTDVAVLMSGEFFVSDGYCNSRVLKFSKDGTFLMSFGKRNVQFGAAPPVVTFDIPHSITVSEEHHLVCVADRENGRIQCFDLDGNFKQVIKRPEFGPRLFALEYCPAHGGLLYAVNGPAFDGPIDTTVQGFTIDINTGDLLEMWNVPDNMRNPHDVAADPVTHSIYVGELDPERVWKFSRPITIQPSSSQHINVEESTQSQLPVSNPLDQSETNTTGLSEAIRDSSDVSPSVIIGILLVVPVILLLIIVLLVRAHQSGKLKCYGHGKKGKVFNLKGFNWNSHKGFDRLSTEESDHEADPDDLDDKDYLTPPKKNKA